LIKPFELAALTANVPTGSDERDAEDGTAQNPARSAFSPDRPQVNARSSRNPTIVLIALIAHCGGAEEWPLWARVLRRLCSNSSEASGALVRGLPIRSRNRRIRDEREVTIVS